MIATATTEHTMSGAMSQPPAFTISSIGVANSPEAGANYNALKLVSKGLMGLGSARRELAHVFGVKPAPRPADAGAPARRCRRPTTPTRQRASAGRRLPVANPPPALRREREPRVVDRHRERAVVARDRDSRPARAPSAR